MPGRILAAARGILECDGKRIDEGFGHDVLGHPFKPLCFLANSLAARGQALLEAGEIVLTGSWVHHALPESG